MTTTTTTPENINERSIQCWPGGGSIHYDANAYDANSADIRIVFRPDPEENAAAGDPIPVDQYGRATRPATPEERRALRIALRAEGYQRHLIHRCQTGLIDDLLKLASDTGGSDLAEEFNFDKIENIRPDPDTMTPHQMREYIDDHSGTAPDLPEITHDCETCNGSGEVEGLAESRAKCGACDGDGTITIPMTQDDADDDDDYTAALATAVHDCAEVREAYEWYAVDSWLLGRLREAGEIVLDNSYGEWWGRTCSGQALIMDGTLQAIAARYETEEV